MQQALAGGPAGRREAELAAAEAEAAAAEAEEGEMSIKQLLPVWRLA